MKGEREKAVKMNWFDRIIHGIEVVGNKLPNPFILFMISWMVILVLSQLLAGIGVMDPRTGERIEIIGLLNTEGLQWMLDSMVDNYINFSPMGTVLAMMLGLGVATSSGLLSEANEEAGGSS